VADGWCWFVLREEYCWLVAGGWFILREKYCWLVADKPSEQGASDHFFSLLFSLSYVGAYRGTNGTHSGGVKEMKQLARERKGQRCARLYSYTLISRAHMTAGVSELFRIDTWLMAVSLLLAFALVGYGAVYLRD
jgi:hypothetical protein